MKHVLCVLAIWTCWYGSALLANNITLSNVTTTGQNTTAGVNAAANFTLVEFDLSWENSWRTSNGPSNWDAAWVFVKFQVGVSNPTFSNITLTNASNLVTLPSVENLRVGMPLNKISGNSTVANNTIITAINKNTNEVTLSANITNTHTNNNIEFVRIWEHASLNTTAINHTAPAGSTIDVPADSVGVFIYRSSDGSGTFSLSDVKLRWDYGINGVEDNAVIQVQVFVLEMVYVPQASFYLGSGGTEAGSFTDGSWTSGATIPFQITSESGLGIDNALGKLWGTTANAVNTGIGNAAADPEAVISNSFPKGFNAFYCMKYELTQGDYRDFLNTLTYRQQANRTANAPNSISGTAALNSSYRDRIAIQTPGNASSFTPAVYACNLNGNATFNEADDGEWIPCLYMTFMDAAAYLDWAGLRPLTELEFEKSCRGNQSPVPGEYAWGNSTISTAAHTLSNAGTTTEGIATNYSLVAGNSVNSSTDGAKNTPLRVGIFAANAGNTGRVTAGASYWGIMELSGNMKEWTVTIANPTGRSFTGVNGNGRLSAAGHANQSTWPGLSNNEVTGTTGAGFRGGDWNEAFSHMLVSSRIHSSFAPSARNLDMGARGVRVSP
jgi:formylglycine-generating enzyme required for sulfatase activity